MSDPYQDDVLDGILARLAALEAAVSSLAPDSAPPVPATIPAPGPPSAPTMTVESFCRKLDAIEAYAYRNGPCATITHACDLGARWALATGRPLPTRPR